MHRLLLAAIVAVSVPAGEDPSHASDRTPVPAFAETSDVLPYPIPRPEGALETELGLLRWQVGQRLLEPQRVRYPNGEIAPIRRMLELAAFIRDPAYFRYLHPLLDDAANRYYVAECLMAYTYPEADDRVRAHRDHVQTVGLCCRTELSIADLVDDPQAPSPSLDALLLTLETGDREQATDAFVQLVEAGVVPEFDTIRAMWPHLDREQQNRVLDRAIKHDPVHAPILAGKHRLRDFVAALASEENTAFDPDVLLVAAYRLGDPSVVPAVDAFIRRCGRDLMEGETYRTPEYMLLSRLASDPCPALLDAYLDLSKSPNAELWAPAWRAIAMTESDEALRAVVGYVRDRSTERHGLSQPFDGFRELAHRSPHGRWARLAICLYGFDVIEAPDSATSYPIIAFEALTGGDFGSDGRKIPGGFSSVDAMITVSRCRAWAVANPERINALGDAMARLGVDHWRPQAGPAPPAPQNLALPGFLTEEQIQTMSVEELRNRLAYLAKLRRQLRNAEDPDARAMQASAEREWKIILGRLSNRSRGPRHLG